jgi:SAM-dependent methyltransferase
MVAPEDLRTFRRHAEWALVVATARELGVVDELASRPRSAEALARELSLSPRGVRILVGALEETGFVRREPDGRARLTGSARAHLLDRDTPDFQGDALDLWLHNIRLWANHLPDAVRTGEPVEEEDAREISEAEWIENFMAAMANKSPRLVESVVDAALERAPGAETMLDLGGGPGTFARGFVERGLEATLFDRPEVLDHVESAYRLDAVDGLELERGDFFETIPEGPFDVVLLANITHIFDPADDARLLARAAGSLAPGGVLAIMDFVRGESDFAPLFAVTMLMNTEDGDTYALSEYRRWLEDAGLEGVRCTDVGEDRQLVTARRPRGEDRHSGSGRPEASDPPAGGER